jgi:hypothetical protein
MPIVKESEKEPDGRDTDALNDWRTHCKGNLTDLRRILHLSLAKGNPK